MGKNSVFQILWKHEWLEVRAKKSDKYFHKFPLITGMWATREMDTSRDREIYVRTTIRELVVYIIFLTVLCICEFNFCILF